ncbi:hypothetical protein CLHUN_41210 [Ruminiclostridium hungatei]|uniref:Uncharacterized protein n=1 Tax=Ruminiclostridium hungatei TaxID=48256 RepID=A0A1V4SES1_RUMHU|nr:ABC transporter substrate-binding protein [Ruminiclostridium hungatei]OPX42006.1 hypothetical protein CLHUN_41210 [Ruminiclostridium hungatei]
MPAALTTSETINLQAGPAFRDNRLSYEFGPDASELCTGDLNAGEYDFMGSVPVPLKYTVKDGLESVLRKHRLEEGKSLKCYFPMGGGSGNYPFRSLHLAENIEDFPNMLLSSAFDNMFSRDFFRRFTDRGCFKSCQLEAVPEIYRQSGIVDPLGSFTVFSVVPMVMLIDYRKLGKLPVPKCWEHLLNPVYKDNIIIGGWRKDLNSPYTESNSFLFLNLYKDYGLESIVSIAHNIKDLIHYVHMSRIAGTDSKSGAAIYIMPWFLADICPRREDTEIVWPLDGALAFPLYLLVKRDKIQKLAPLLEFLMGSKIGQYLSDNKYPPLNPQVEYCYPRGASLKWVGWDYIRSNDTVEILDNASKKFFEIWHNKKQTF